MSPTLRPHPGHLHPTPATTPADDRQMGPDHDEWPGEQLRRLDDRYRSWRQDRYRENSDARHPRRETHHDAAPTMRRER